MASTTLKHLKIKRSTRQITQELMPFALLFISLNFFSCKKDNPTTLPPATQNGANTMGAYVNNVLWVPALSFSNPGIKADFGIPVFSIFAITGNSNDHTTTSVLIKLFNFNSIGNYTLASSPSDGLNNNAGGVSTGTSSSPLNYITDILHQGTVIITHFDPSKGIVSGTFKMTLVNQINSLDTLLVTNGRFDLTCPLNQF